MKYGTLDEARKIVFLMKRILKPKYLCDIENRTIKELIEEELEIYNKKTNKEVEENIQEIRSKLNKNKGDEK